MPDYISRDEKTGNPVLVDLRELCLRYRIPIKGIEKFFEGLDQGIIYGTRCPVCGARYFPPQAWCSGCGYGGPMEFYPLNTRGHLLTFTRIYTKPKSFAGFDDYTVGIARLDEEGINVLAWLDEDIKEPRVGMEVTLTVRKREGDGAIVYFISKETKP